MSLLDKAKAAAAEASAKTKQSAHELQAKHELGDAYDALGKLTFELVQLNELSHPKLEKKVEEIRGLRAELDVDETPS